MKKLLIVPLLIISFFAKGQTFQQITPQWRALQPGVSRFDSLGVFWPGKYGGVSYLWTSALIKHKLDSLSIPQFLSSAQFSGTGSSIDPFTIIPGTFVHDSTAYVKYLAGSIQTITGTYGSITNNDATLRIVGNSTISANNVGNWAVDIDNIGTTGGHSGSSQNAMRVHGLTELNGRVFSGDFYGKKFIINIDTSIHTRQPFMFIDSANVPMGKFYGNDHSLQIGNSPYQSGLDSGLYVHGKARFDHDIRATLPAYSSGTNLFVVYNSTNNRFETTAGGGGGTTTNPLTQGFGINPFTFNGSTSGVHVVIDTASAIKSKAGFNTDYTNLSSRITTNAGNIATNTTNIALKAYSLIPTAVKTTTYTAAVNDFVPCDNTSGSFTVTLPTAPADKSLVAVKMVTQSGTNTITITAAGSDVFNVAGGSTSLTLNYNKQGILLQYKSSSAIWYVLDNDLPLAGLDLRYASLGGSYSDPAWITSLAYSKITGVPSFLTANQSITFTPTGDVTGSVSGATSLTPALTIGAGKVVNSMIAASTIDLTAKVTGLLPDANISSATNWNSAYTNRITSITNTGSSGAATLVSNVLNVPNYTLVGLGGFANPLTTTGDIIYSSSGGTAARLGIGATGNPLIVIGGLPAYSNLVFTNPASAATLTLAAGKTVTVNNTITVNATDGITMTTPTTSFTAARTDAANTFTGHQTIEGVTSTGAIGTGKFVFDNTTTFTGVTTFAQVNSPVVNGTTGSATTLQNLNVIAVGSGTTTQGYIYRNGTAATSGTPVQNLGNIDLRYNVWNTSGTPASNQVDWLIQGRATSSGTPGYTLVFGSSLGTGTISGTDRMSLDQAGNLSLLTGRLFQTLGAGDATLSSGTVAVTISGVTTSSRAQVTRTVASGTTLTTGYTAVCTANTLTITADVAAGTINTADNSTYTYVVIN